MYENFFKVLPYCKANLCEALANERCPPNEVLKTAKLDYLDKYLGHPDINAKTILIESDYTDGEYLEDYASYYSKCHYGYARHCKRVHFFDEDLDRQTIIEALAPATPERDKRLYGLLEHKYLGFIVARPLPEAIIGRTLLKTYKSDSGRRHYSCAKSFRVNLFGLKLTVETLPFQEQDTVLAACATVALWSCLQRTASVFGTVAPRPATITHAANTIVKHARPIPSHGLVLEQICRAIQIAGLEPEVMQINPNVPLGSLCYAYLKRGFPILIGGMPPGAPNEAHAVAVAGYSKTPTVSQTHETMSTSCAPMIGLQIDELYIHDDQLGPFAKAKIVPPDRPSKTPALLQYLTKTFQPTIAVVPIYNKIRVTFLEAEQWITRTQALFMNALPQIVKLQWELFLEELTHLKGDIRLNPEIKTNDKLALLLKSHPRFVWRAILYADGVPAFELLIDATDMARSQPAYATIWYSDPRASLVGFMQKFKANLEPYLTEPYFDFLLSEASSWKSA